MAERVNRNVEWVTDDNGDVVGYQVKPGDVRSLVSGAGKRNRAVQIVSGNSRASAGQQPAGVGTAWMRNIRNVVRGVDGLVYIVATTAHGIPANPYVYAWNVGKANFEFNNQQFRAATLAAVPADVVAYVAADGGAATTANTFVLLDAPSGGVNTLAADAGNYTLEMAYGMAGATSYQNAYAGRRFKKVINIAKGGARLADWLLDVPAIISHPALPKFSYTEMLTNDWDGLADSQSAVDVLIGQYKGGIATILGADMLHQAPNLIPIVAMTATQIKNLNRINRAFEAEIWSMDGVIGVNHYGQIVDRATGLGRAAYFFPDNYHTKGSGSVRLGKVDAEAVNAAAPLVPSVAPSAPSTKNALANPWMNGVGSGTASAAGSGAAPAANTGVAASWIVGLYRAGLLTGVDFASLFCWLQDSTPGAWPANTAAALWRTVAPTEPNGFCYVASTVGGSTHATTEPTWPTTLFATVVDGGVTWTCVPYVNDGTLARMQGIRVVGGTLPDNSFIRLSQTGILLSGLSGDNAIAVGDQVQMTARVRIFAPTGANLGIEGVNLAVRGAAAIDGNFASGRDLAKSDFFDGAGDVSLWPVDWSLGTHPDFRLQGAQTAIDVMAEFLLDDGGELIALVSDASLHKSPA